jgi:enoyl-[acyl-carrier protein] reductase II
MAAAFAVGAEGIQMGTRFVSSQESPVHENFKNQIFESSINGTWVLNKTSKPVIRALRTDFTKDILEAGKMDMSAMGKIQDLYFGGDMNAAPALSGQSVGLIDGVKSAKEIIDDTIKEFNETCSKLGNIKL